MPPRCANAPSAAKLFVQLSSSTRQSQSAAVLDVFLPRQTTRAFRAATAAAASTVVVPRRTMTIPQRDRRLQQQQLCAALPRRPFSASSYRQRTQAILNRQVDENGQEMMLEITPRAAQRLTKIMTKDQNPHLALRIQVESGGCHGFQYRMGLVTLPESMTASKPTPSSDTSAAQPDLPSAETEAEMAPSTTAATEPLQADISEDDTIFAFAQQEGAEASTLAAAPKIVLDGPSLDLLKGSKLDFTMELIGSQFKIVDNPAATSSCGCGTSFDIKM